MQLLSHTKIVCCERELPFTNIMDDSNVGEEMVVFYGRHGSLQNVTALEVMHQDAQTVQVRMFWCDYLKDGLMNNKEPTYIWQDRYVSV